MQQVVAKEEKGGEKAPQMKPQKPDRSFSRVANAQKSELRKDARGFPIKDRPFGVWKDGKLWNNSSVGKLVKQHDPNLKTLYDLTTNAFASFKDHRGVGVRELIRRDFLEDPKNPGKKFEKLTLGGYSWITYGQWGERTKNFADGMVSMGNLQANDRVLIYAETQRDWMTTAMASFRQSLTVVTAYATLGADAAAFAINITKAKMVVADAKLLRVLLSVVSQCPTLKTVVSMAEVSDEDRKQLESLNIKVATYEEVLAEGKAKPIEDKPPKPEDQAVIMFTSGTTGNPKGVVLLHSCVVAAIAGMDHMFGGSVSEKDVYCAYLPLAHIMEMVAEISMICVGVSVGFGSPHTLTASGVKLAEGQQGDMSVLQPTVVVFAPLVLEKVYNSIVSKVSAGSKFAQWMFNTAMSSAVEAFERGEVGANWFWNSIVFKKIQAMVGGKLRIVLTGSAPLDGNVHKFVQSCLNCPVRQGYGATETSAASVVQEVIHNKVSSVGPPRVSCCIKLVDWEEGNYRFSDKDNAEIGMPRGEIVIGGELVAAGYIVDEANPDPEVVSKNETDFKTDEDGVRWFYTGDIGQVDADGCLQIIDRKKDLVKLQQGEYVALSKVEGVLKLSPYVENALCHVSPHLSFCTALVCPQANTVAALAKELGIEGELENICKDERLVKAVLKSCQEVAKGKLAAFEIPKKITLVEPSRTWTPENELLTAAMKLKRKPIANAHAEEISAMCKTEKK